MKENTQDTVLLKARNTILHMVATGESLTPILHEIAQEIEAIIPDAFCSILLINEEDIFNSGIGPSLDNAYLKNLEGIKIGPGIGSCGTAAYTKKTVITENIETAKEWEEFRSLALTYGLRACWSKPVLNPNQRVLGTFALYYKESKRPTQAELEVLEVFTHMASIAIENKRTNEKLSSSEEHYRLLAENASDFIGIINQDGKYEYVSSSHEKYLGYSSQELLGTSWPEFMHPDDMEKLKYTFEMLIKTDQTQHIAFRAKHKQGHWMYLEGTGTPIKDNNNESSRIVYISRDVTEQKKAEQQLTYVLQELEQTQQKFDSIYANSLDAIFEINSEGYYYSANDVAEQLTGYNKQELLLLGFLDLIVEAEEATDIFTRVKKGEAHRGELTLIHKEGYHLIIDVNAVPMSKKDGSVNVIAFVQDITSKRQAENKIRDLAYTDSLTGLPSRNLFRNTLEKAIKTARTTKIPFGVLFIDFDNFKKVNDTMGHHNGDLLLQQAVPVIQKCLRKQDVLSRQHGDEFLILLESVTEKEICLVAEKIINELNKPIQVAGKEVLVTPSIGISMIKDCSENAETLIKNADLAMYSAKQKGKNNYQFYSHELHERAVRKARLEDALRLAVAKNEFTLHYQSKIDIGTNEIAGVEALLRWNPSFGPVSPMEFIPVAEETGMIVGIGEWVLREACRQRKQWQDTGVLNTPVAVNVSARQFKEPNFIDMVENVLRDTSLPADQLEIEITESVMIDVKDAKCIISQLRKLGIRIAVDDFGTGYSSLNMIKNFDIDTLKIDQSFLFDVMRDRKAAGLLKMIIQMGKEIDAIVVVEGIETEEQVRFLESYNVIGQGYYYSRPVSGSDFEKNTLFSAPN